MSLPLKRLKRESFWLHLGFNKIIILSDALEVVQAIKGTSNWSLNSVLFDITASFCLVDLIDVLYIPIVFNQAP